MKTNCCVLWLFGLLLGGFLAACGGGKVDTAAFKQASSEELGITIGYPEAWVADFTEGDIQLATSQELFDSPDKVDEGALVIITGFDQAMTSLLSPEEIEPGDAVALLDVFREIVLAGEEEATIREEAKAVQYNGHAAAMMIIDAKSEAGEDLFIMLTAVPNENVIVYLFAATPAAQEEEMRPLFDAILNTIDLSTPTLSNVVDEEVAAALAPPPTSAPEPTATAASSPTPAPTATPNLAADFADATSEGIGVTISYPAGWVTEVTENGDLRLASDPAWLGDPEQMETGMLVQITNLPQEALAFIMPADADPNDPVAVVEAFVTLIAGTEGDSDAASFTQREAAAAVTMGGYDGAAALYDVSSNDLDGTVKFVALADPDNGRIVFIFAATPLAAEADYLPILEAMLPTIKLSVPTASGLFNGVDDTETITQWATFALASSEYTPSDWSAEQAMGEPDTFECGDQVTAWASADSDTEETILLGYDELVYVTQINIYQTYNPDQVTAVDLVDEKGDFVPVYEGTPTAVADTCPYVLSIPLDGDILADGVRITLDQSQLGLGWNEIDAVELVGFPEGDTGALPPPTSGSSPVGMVGSGGPATVRDDVPRITPEPGMTMFTNGNEVMAIAVHGGQVYAATGGGLVAWDYASGEPVGQWTTLEGLGHNVAQAVTICDVPEERIVIGTKAGLSLYDPASDTFENWTPDNSGMSSDDGVVSLACVPQAKALVIGYDLDGVDVYEVGRDTWTYYEPFDDLESGWAEALAVKGDLDEIWVAHIGAVSRINHRQGTVDYYDDESGLDDASTDNFEDFVEDILVDNSGTVWFAQGGGLTRVDGDGQFTFIASEDIPGWPFWSGTDDLALGPDGTIWTNDTLGGICQFDPASQTCLTSFEDEEGMADDFNNGLFVDDIGQIFYGSEGEGISYYDGAAWHNFKLETKPLFNEFRAIAQGADGSIWVGGYNGGHQFFAYDVAGTWADLSDHLTWNGVNVFYPEADGMWVGHTGGASFYDYDSGAWADLENADEAGAGIYQGDVTSIARDSQGRLWFGTTGGVTVWDGDTFTYMDLLTETERKDGRSPRWIHAILAEGDNVWVGGVNALYRFDASDSSLQTFTRWDDADGLPGFFPSVNALAQDQDGNVLVAVDDTLLQNDGNDFVEIYQAGYAIHTVIVDNEGGIALGTDGGGLHILLDGAPLILTTAEGLPTNNLTGQNILVDYLETLWIAASEGGILQIAP